MRETPLLGSYILLYMKRYMPHTVRPVIYWEPDGYFSDGISVTHQGIVHLNSTGLTSGISYIPFLAQQQVTKIPTKLYNSIKGSWIMEWKFHVMKVKKMKSAADADAQMIRLLAAWLTDSLSAKCLQKLQLLLALKFINNGGNTWLCFRSPRQIS